MQCGAPEEEGEAGGGSASGRVRIASWSGRRRRWGRRGAVRRVLTLGGVDRIGRCGLRHMLVLVAHHVLLCRGAERGPRLVGWRASLLALLPQVSRRGAIRFQGLFACRITCVPCGLCLPAPLETLRHQHVAAIPPTGRRFPAHPLLLACPSVHAALSPAATQLQGTPCCPRHMLTAC